jgi:Ferritin-like
MAISAPAVVPRSRMWGLNWGLLDKVAPRPVPPKAQKAHDLTSAARATGLFSIPGRTPRLKAIYLLQIAAEIEHSLMLQYLYAAYSIDQKFAFGEGDSRSETVNRWRRNIRTVARQEMAHLVTVQNLLIAVGGNIYLQRENNFLTHPDEYPFPTTFEKLSRASLAKYVATEGPDPSSIAAPADRRLLRRILKEASASVHHKVNRVGALYAVLYWLFMESDRGQGPWRISREARGRMLDAGLGGIHLSASDFASRDEFSRFAATPGEWDVYEPRMRVDRTDPRRYALNAIHWIMAQGEGFEPLKGEENMPSHFHVFMNLFREMTTKKMDFGGAIIDVPTNPVATGIGSAEARGTGSRHLTNPVAKLWAQLCDLRYQMLLLDLLLALSTERANSLRTTLTNWAVSHEMRFVARIAQLLPGLNARPEGSLRAGAPFETIAFPDDDAKRWDVQAVLMTGTLSVIQRLKKIGQVDDIQGPILNEILAFDRSRRAIVEENRHSKTRYRWRNGRVQRD